MKYLVLCAMLSAGIGFTSCGDDEEDDDLSPNNSTEQNNGQNNQNNNGGNNNGNGGQTNNNGQTTDNNGSQDNNAKPGSLAEFYAKFPISQYSVFQDNVLTSYDKYYDQFKALVPAGIYVFSEGNNGKDKIVLGKGTDGSIMVFSMSDLTTKCAFVGSSLYTSSYGDDGKNNAYMFYNDQFGKSMDYKPAPSLCKYEYESREDLLQAVFQKDACRVAKIHDAITTHLIPWFFSDYGDEQFTLHSEGKTTLNGIECNYYYVTYNGNGQWIMADSAPEKVQEWWLTDDFICLQHYTYEALGGDTWCNLDRYMPPAGDFEQTYQAINKEFSAHGETTIAEALTSTKKYGNYWVSEAYPDYLNEWLVRYEGPISSFEVGRRAWKGTDQICSITIECTESTADDIKAYIEKVKELNFPDVYEDSQLEFEKFQKLTPEQRAEIGLTDEMMERLEKANTTSITYRAAYEALGDLGLGKTGIYPSYEITYSNVVAGFKTVRIVFDLVRLTGV